MLGFGDFGIFAAFVLCVISAVACVVYGIVNWNNGAETAKEIEADEKWDTTEKEMAEKLDI